MYSVLVKIDGFESRKRNAGLLHLVLGFFLIVKSFDFYYYSVEPNILSILPVLIVASLSLYYGFFRKRIDPGGQHNLNLRFVQSLTFVLFGVAMIRIGRSWDYIGLFIWGFLALILMVTERRIFGDTAVTFTEEGVQIPGYFKDFMISWSTLDSVIVRHDFITINHLNNRYMQFQVMQTLSELEVAKMNAYCTEQIEKVAEGREA